ncbi:COG1565: Uncharacterized conserved protein [hydrothermal vent metagenome]|uniref:COG1565: Uncharacterized conserved protein n=1 Tax=hydrothermal vent metagenome TaxID=652676 RepID=A0A1W1CS14_9ZZZZ
MLGTVLLSVFVLIILFIVIREVRNEKKYQEERRQKLQKKDERTLRTNPPVVKSQKEKPQGIKPQKIEEVQRVDTSTPLPQKTAEKKVEQKALPKEEKKLPSCSYPIFTHGRLIEMGLSDGEAKEFVQELIPQLEVQIPLIEEAFQNKDFHQMERLTHSIKGSATNLGTGGVSDLLIEFNTYLKTGIDIEFAKVYLDSLKHYTQTLKEQYR